VQPDKVRQMKLPADVDENCKAWAQWSKCNVVDQIDSGA
jgi:hypothetical protein